MMEFPRKGHLNEVFHIFGYLKFQYNSKMVFDPIVSDFDDTHVPQEDWIYNPYNGTKEHILKNHPEARGLGFKLNRNVDSDHAGDYITRRLGTGFIIIIF